MNLNDIIALAKSGYKKKDIDELLALELPEPEPEPEPENGAKGSPDVLPEPEPEEKSDHIEELEALKAANEEMKKQLEALQRENREKNNGGKTPAEEAAERQKRLEALAKSYM